MILTGPPIGIKADVAPLLTLVLHEVITNAAKHGALSSPDGIIRARWVITDTGLHFEWHEINSHPVPAPTRTGFGRMLIEKAIPFELDGKANLTFEPAGLLFACDLPKQHLTELDSESVADAPAPPETTGGNIAGKSVLIVEDNMLLAYDLAQTVSRLGAAIIQTAASLKEGLELARSGYFDVAIMDLSLRGEPCFPIASQLQARAIPFLFVSGYNSAVDMPEEHQTIPLLSKPVEECVLDRKLKEILSGPARSL